MNSVKIAYIIVMEVSEIFLICMAIAAPVWITPGYYWWTAFGIILMFSASICFTKRLNSWSDFGKVE